MSEILSETRFMLQDAEEREALLHIEVGFPEDLLPAES